MHGIIFTELKKFVDRRGGSTAWAKVTADAKLGQSVFLTVGTYPDEQLMKLVASSSRALGMPVPEVVEAFGVYLAPVLLETYRAPIKPEWTALDMLEHVEDVMHAAVRKRADGAAPPPIETTRVSRSRVLMRYRSPRRLCALARGLIRGVGQHYGEALLLKETACMLTGSEACVFEVDQDPARALKDGGRAGRP